MQNNFEVGCDITPIAELLQVAFGYRAKKSIELNERQWHALLEEAVRQAVVGILFEGIELLSNERTLEKSVLMQWIGMVQASEHTSRLHLQRAKELTELVKNAGFSCCVLKGQSAARRYPNPLRRQCGDIDLWTGKPQQRKEIISWLQKEYEVEHLEWHHAGVNIFKDVPVEIHFHPSWLYNPMHNRRLQRFFDREREQQMKERDEGFSYTTNEFDSVYQLTHIFHHLLEEGVGLRHIIDYYYVIKDLRAENDNLKVASLLETINTIGLTKFLGAMMYVLHKICGMPRVFLLCTPNEKEGQFLLEEVMASGNFGHQRKGENLKRNSIKRLRVMAKHYPSEVLWMVPWKIGHWCWRKRRGYI